MTWQGSWMNKPIMNDPLIEFSGASSPDPDDHRREFALRRRRLSRYGRRGRSVPSRPNPKRGVLNDDDWMRFTAPNLVGCSTTGGFTPA